MFSYILYELAVDQTGISGDGLNRTYPALGTKVYGLPFPHPSFSFDPTIHKLCTNSEHWVNQITLENLRNYSYTSLTHNNLGFFSAQYNSLVRSVNTSSDDMLPSTIWKHLQFLATFSKFHLCWSLTSFVLIKICQWVSESAPITPGPSKCSSGWTAASPCTSSFSELLWKSKQTDVGSYDEI